MSSPARPPLRVEVPSESGASTSQPSDDSVHNGSKWGRMLQSPSLLAEKTASFTAKLAGGLTGKSRGAGAKRPIQPRASVNPRQRAAQDAQYRTVLSLKQEAAAAAGSPQAGGGGARGGGGGGGKDAGVRDVHFAPQGAPGPPPLPETNRVVTSKYNVVTFLPIFLFEMFSRVAYLYFLLQAGLSWWSVVSPYSGVGSTAALLFVLAVAAVKAIWEDVKRHQEDQRMNTSVTHRLNPDGSVTDVAWTDVAVGDAIVVRDDENFPADLLCLRSALPDNVCFIRTTNLDGETNLKIRKPLDVKGLRLASMPEVMTLDLTLKAEAPNKNLHKFRGKAVVRNQAYADMPISPGSDRMLWEAGGGGGGGGAPDGPAPPAPPTPSVEVAVTMNEMLLRGCTLKNSGEIVGLVVYTGKQTRIQMNATKTPLKIGSFDRFLNFQITLVIIMQLAMCLFLAVANYIWQRRVGRDHPYLALDADVQGIYANGLLQVVINFLTFWILLSYLVPISLFVTLEIVKFWQGFVFINLDKGLRDPATGEYARCRNSNLNEDLGKVEYVFSDKTGTLTSNEMQLRQLSIKGEVFGSAAFRLEDHPALAGAEALRRFDRRLAAAAAAARAAPGWDSLVVGGGSAARLMAYHSSNPSYGTAASAGLARAGRGASATLDDFDPSAPDDGAAPAPRATLALGHHLVDFFTNLLICQSLILDEDEAGGPPRYQGPSPDEVALVEAARQVGFVFQSRSQTGVSLSMLGKEVAYEVLNVMEYSSERGCMSVVARCPDGTVRLYCKGADAKVMRKVRGSTDPALVARSEDNLHTFARAGLRTLVLASKVIPEAAYREWDARFQEASRLFEGRDAALDGLGNEIERDLELIGVTAIEDKLQEGVPAAIKTLLAANVRVWMITGDKQETAVNIAVSCDLVRDVDGVMVLNVDEKAEDAAGQAASLLEDCARRLCEQYAASRGLPPAQAPASLEAVEDTWRQGELAVDGPTLTFILADPALRRRLAQVAARCSGVVVSRSSPSQKAAVVRNMAEYEMAQAAGSARGALRWYRRYRQRLRGKMLAIGDGANDVAMIQTADVGVGIMGKEGRQAVNNADYAFSQFRFLVPLLLVHGNLSYYRLARLIKYSFYKNITFAFVMFYYQFYNGFSGQALVDSITAAVFNVAFTSLPICLFAVMDRPVKELHAFVRYPQLYDKRRCRSLTTASFWKGGILQGAVHGAVAFFVPYYCISTSGTHNITDVYSLGRVTFVALLGSVTLEVALIARYWTWAFFWVTLLSYLMVYPYMLAFPWAELAFGYYDPANFGVSSAVLSSPSFWFILLVCYVATAGSRFAERTGQWVFRPHDTMILAEKEAAAARAGRGGLLTGLTGASRARLAALGTLPGGRAAAANGAADAERGGAGEGLSAWESGGAADTVDPRSGGAPADGAAGDSVKEWERLQGGAARA